MTIAKAGSLLRVESGEYSDYTVHGFFVVLSSFDPQEIRQAYTGPQHTYAFLAELIRQGLLLEIEASELHLGYIDLEKVLRFTPIRDDS